MIRSIFIREQLRHDCIDCGQSYLTHEWPGAVATFQRVVAGGGTLSWDSSEPVREIHIIPHGGTEIPDGLLEHVGRRRLQQLADLVHQNSDLGTGSIYRWLTERLARGELPGVAVAGFHLSRLLLDANRVDVRHQLPVQPYAGTADLYADYHLHNGRWLLDEMLTPWLDAVGKMLSEMDETCTVYHHHTYDLVSLSPRPWDQAHATGRPAFQLAWRRPANDDLMERENGGRETEYPADLGLAPIDQTQAACDRIGMFFEHEFNVSDGSGALDYPLTLPPAPFIGMCMGDPPSAPRHVVYDVRKDMLSTADRIDVWMHKAPWRIPALPPSALSA